MKKMFKKVLLSVAIVAAMLLGICINVVPEKVNAKSKTSNTVQIVKLTKSKVSLKVGKTKKIKVEGATGKVKWSSDDASVAKVKKGKITAKAPGKCYIIAKVDGIELMCKVTVKAAKNKQEAVIEEKITATPVVTKIVTETPVVTGTQTVTEAPVTTVAQTVTETPVMNNNQVYPEPVGSPSVPVAETGSTGNGSIQTGIVEDSVQGNPISDIHVETCYSTASFLSIISKLTKYDEQTVGENVMNVESIHTNRVIVSGLPDFEGFNPDVVLESPWGEYIVQFTNTAEAQRFIEVQKTNPDVVYVEEDAYYYVDGVEDEETLKSNLGSWGTDYIEAPALVDYILKTGLARSILVAIPDTGSDLDHPFYKDRLYSAGVDCYYNRGNADDKVHGHGTHVAGTIADCTQGLPVKILPIRVLGENGYGTSLTVATGIRVAADMGADVINLSLGGGHSDLKDSAIEYALGKGSTVCVAAGNENQSTSGRCPAHIEKCIVVSAINQSELRASFSNYGQSVDVAAPGVSIRSSVPNNRYESWHGTSMATPHASASAAMIKMLNPSFTPAQVEETLKKCTKDLGASGKDDEFGYGAIKLSKLIPAGMSSIEIMELPKKTTYFVGESLVTNGLKLKAVYRDGSYKVVDNGYSCTPTRLDNVGEQTVQVSYEGFTTSFKVQVKPVEVEKVEIATLPSKLVYHDGNKLDLTGLSLKVTYSNGKVETITEGYTYTPTVATLSDVVTTAGYSEKRTITVTYKGKTAKFEITVNAVYAGKLEIVTLPSNRSYFAGDRVNTTGLRLKVTFSDGSSKEIDEGYSIFPDTLTGSGKQNVKVSFAGLTTEYEVEVSEVVLEYIKIDTLPTKTVYEVGEEFDPSGITITAGYTNGFTKHLSDGFTYTPSKLNTLGRQAVMLMYGSQTATLYVDVVETRMEFGPFSEWSTTPAYPSENREVETRQVPKTYHMITICCGNSSGYRCYLPYMQSGYTKRAEPYYETMTKQEFDSCTVWKQGSYFTYATNVNGYIIGPGDAYVLPGGYTPWYISSIDYETQYRYRDKIRVTYTAGGQVVNGTVPEPVD